MIGRLGFQQVPVADSGEAPDSLCAARMFGVRAWWSVMPNRGELARRRGARVSALRRLPVVDALLGLPIDVPVADRSLSLRERRALTDLPSCVLDRIDGHVVRRSAPPLRIDHVVVPARMFRRGLEAASSFSTYCARSMALATAGHPTETELAEADYYGVGVYIADGDRLVELVRPEPLPDWPETPASWVFTEALCDRLALFG